MEESIKIQEEFENLIEQLERLKNINELTSANTESSKRVIEQIGSFVNSMNQYKETLDENSAEQSLKIQNLIDSLNESLNAVVNQKNIVSESVEISFLGLQKTTVQLLESHKTELNDISDKTFKFIENRTKELSKILKDSLELHEKQLKDLKSDTKISINSLTENVSNKVASNQKSIVDFNTTLLAKIENTENNLIETSAKQITTLTSMIDENKSNFIEKFKTQDKEIKTLKTLLFIICGLIVIGTVATIFVLK